MTLTVICKRRTGVEGFIYEIVESAAMELVGSRLHCEIKEPSARLPELCCVITGLHCDFLHRFDTGLGLRGVPKRDAVGGVLPLHADRRRIALHAIQTD